jgi:hypothetical protein
MNEIVFNLADIMIGIGMGILFIIGLIWYMAGRLEYRIRQALEASQEHTDLLMGLKVEQVNGVLYCYEHGNNQFVCQGNTVLEIREAFKIRYPNKVAYLSEGDPALIEQLRKQIKESNSENSSSV